MHPPQFAVSFVVLTQAPLHAVTKGAVGHATAHAPPLQAATPFGGVGHAVQLAPQCAGSVWVA
jgi:hypothetical protein